MKFRIAPDNELLVFFEDNNAVSGTIYIVFARQIYAGILMLLNFHEQMIFLQQEIHT